MRKRSKQAADPSHHRKSMKNTLYGGQNHLFFIKSRMEPRLQAGRMWRPSDVTPFDINTENEDRVFASWRKKSWAMDEAMEYNGWTLTLTMVWLNGNGNWKRCLKRIRRVVRSKKQTEWDKVDCYHERGGGLLSIDWLEDKKTWLNYKRDVCDALVVSRPWMIVYKKVLLKSSLGWSRNGLGSNEFLGKN